MQPNRQIDRQTGTDRESETRGRHEVRQTDG